MALVGLKFFPTATVATSTMTSSGHSNALVSLKTPSSSQGSVNHTLETSLAPGWGLYVATSGFYSIAYPSSSEAHFYQPFDPAQIGIAWYPYEVNIGVVNVGGGNQTFLNWLKGYIPDDQPPGEWSDTTIHGDDVIVIKYGALVSAFARRGNESSVVEIYFTTVGMAVYPPFWQAMLNSLQILK